MSSFKEHSSQLSESYGTTYKLNLVDDTHTKVYYYVQLND